MGCHRTCGCHRGSLVLLLVVLREGRSFVASGTLASTPTPSSVRGREGLHRLCMDVGTLLGTNNSTMASTSLVSG